MGGQDARRRRGYTLVRLGATGCSGYGPAALTNVLALQAQATLKTSPPNDHFHGKRPPNALAITSLRLGEVTFAAKVTPLAHPTSLNGRVASRVQQALPRRGIPPPEKLAAHVREQGLTATVSQDCLVRRSALAIDPPTR